VPIGGLDVETSESRDRRVVWWIVIVVLVAFTAIQTYQTFRVPMFGSSDVQSKGSMLLKHMYPDLFQDEVFGVLEPERVHSPIFFAIMSGLTRLTGSPETAMGLVVPVVYLVFMFGMFKLLAKIGIVWPVALGATLLSTVNFYTVIGPWAFYYLNTALPRNWHTAILPWVLFISWPWLMEDVRQRPALQAVSMGLAVGLSVNLHPSNAYAIAEIIGFLLVLRLIRGEVSFSHLGTYVLGGLIGAFPYLAHLYVQRNPNEVASAGNVSFSRFVEVVNERILYKFPYPTLRVAGHTVTANGQVWLAWVYLALTLLFAFFFIRAWKQGRMPEITLLLSFGLVLLAMAWILTVDQELILIALIYWVARTVSKRLDKVDLRLMEFLLACLLLGFVFGGWLLELLWRTFQAVSLTPFITEQGQVIRFLFFPLIVFLARFADWAWLRLGVSPRIMVALAALMVFVLPSGSVVWLVFTLLVLGLMIGSANWKNRPWWAESLLFGAVSAIACRLIFEVFGLDEFSIHALLVGMAAAICWLVWRLSQRLELRLGLSLVIVFLFAVGLLTIPGNFSGQPVTLAMAISQQVPDDIRQNWGVERLNVDQAYLDEYELSQWAAQSTKEHSLFYYDGIRFRFWSQRNLTHGRKEIATAINTASAEVAIALSDRYKLFEAGYQDPVLLQDLVVSNAVDYVVFQPGLHRMENIPDTWSIVFENDRYTVFQVQ
jgi:hypothetical protein